MELPPKPGEAQNSLPKKISGYYEKASYSDIYSNDIWFTIITFTIVIVIALYFYIKSSLQSYKNSWEKHKCNPLFMPFASIINRDKVVNNDLEYITNNFNECLNILNDEVAQDNTVPIDSVFSYVENFFAALYVAFMGVQSFIVYLFKLIMRFVLLINNSVQVLLLEIKIFFMNTNDFLRKIISSITVIYYTIILVIRSWKLTFYVFIAGFLISVVMPTSIGMISALIGWLISYLLFLMFWSTPIVGWILMWSCIPLMVVFGITYQIFLILLVLVIFIHVQLGEFINRIL
jgi:hypothetical protein